MTPTETADYANIHSGFTYNFHSKKMMKSGFAVSIHKDMEFIVYEHVLCAKHIMEFVTKHYMVRTKDLCLGGWQDAGKWYLDYSIVVQDKETAKKLAIENNQKAFFDLSNFETIFV